jgi:carbohydrate kinase (thermoresistant glucokinase family)
MGVSASGKSTLGRALAETLVWAFVEGDEFHSAENVKKMSRGFPLNDHDREPWLKALNNYLLLQDKAGIDVVLACSALKQHYREMLGEGIGKIQYVYLWGDSNLIRQRLVNRKGHFMSEILLNSQLADLEPPQDAICVGIGLSLKEQIAWVLQAIPGI